MATHGTWEPRSTPEERYARLKAQCRAYQLERYRMRVRLRRLTERHGLSDRRINHARQDEREALVDLVELIADDLAEHDMLREVATLLMMKASILRLTERKEAR